MTSEKCGESSPTSDFFDQPEDGRLLVQYPSCVGPHIPQTAINNFSITPPFPEGGSRP